jgi:adenylate kinase family enzyme/nucleoside diphosphate kinase
MLALGERPRNLVLLRPDLLQKGVADEICAEFQKKYLEVKARKQVYLAKQEAERFFHYQKPEMLKATAAAFARGICEVVVLEHVTPIEKWGDVVPLSMELVNDSLVPKYGAGAIFCCGSDWECMRAIEFFFPYLDALPVERALAVIKPDGIAHEPIDGSTLEQALETKAADAGLVVVGKKLPSRLSKDEAKLIYPTGSPPEGQHVILSLEGRGAIGKLQSICGPPNAGLAREIAPTTLRAAWGSDNELNAVHASISAEAAEKELGTFFPDGFLKMQRTLCIIKPDGMENLFKIRAEIEDCGFTILREAEVKLTEDRAMEFYEDQKAKPSFNGLIKEATSGPCVVAVCCRLEAISVFQQLIGPESVKDAQVTRPKSLRAKYGRDIQRNAVHGSADPKAAAREVRFFFPEMGADPSPDSEEVSNFLFRKGATASMNLLSVSESNQIGPDDPALQQLLSKGLIAMCQAKPKGLGAVKWLSKWLAENNPTPKPEEPSAPIPFEPPERAARYVENGVNKDGLSFVVQLPAPTTSKPIVEVDVSQESPAYRELEFTTPPYVVFVTGGPGSGKTAICAKIREEFNFIHLSMRDLCEDEAQAGTYLGNEIGKCYSAGKPIPDDIIISILKKTMVKHQDTNRFLLDDFPRSTELALKFEHEIAEVAFILHLQGSVETMKARLEGLAKKKEAWEIDEAMKIYMGTMKRATDYYLPLGKVRTVNADSTLDEVYEEARRYFCCRFVYLLGPPGAPLKKVGGLMEQKYGFSAISLLELLTRYVTESSEADVAKVKQCLAKGAPVDASIACPLIVSEIFRDMALGVQNFVICDFPQTLQQAQFLEHRIPCITKPLLLDATRADAVDMAAMGDEDPMMVEMRMVQYFGPDFAKMTKQMPSLASIPLTLEGMATSIGKDAMAVSDTREEKTVNVIWKTLSPKVTPKITIVLGPPGSGTSELAQHIASLTPNTQAVDCTMLLDRELERRTEIGITMHNMLARGQVVPLTMTLELLKDAVNLTCSDSLVITNCPLYVDQIEYIANEFQIDRVFCIEGTQMDTWKQQFMQESADESAAEVFDERVAALQPIVKYFARRGMLERCRVTTSPDLPKVVKAATMPQFAIVTSMSDKLAEMQAASLAKACDAGPPITVEFLQKWAEKRNMPIDQRVVDPTPERVFSALKKYADATGYRFLVLNKYPAGKDDAAAFVAEFGDPKVVLNVTLQEAAVEEFMSKEWEALQDANEALTGNRQEKAEDYPAKLKAAVDSTFDEFSARCPAAVMNIEWIVDEEEDPIRIAEQHAKISREVKGGVKPRAYIVVTPPGTNDFGGTVAEAICTSKREGKKSAEAGGGLKSGPQRPQKFTVLDAREMVKLGHHKPDIEKRLAKALFSAEAADCIPISLWAELFQEAFDQSSDPFGTFLVTNFPTPCSVQANSAGPTIRDQFHLMAEVSDMHLLFIKFSDVAFAKLQIGDNSEELASFQDFDLASFEERVSDPGSAVDSQGGRFIMPKSAKHYYWKTYTQGKVQYNADRICECSVTSVDNLESTVSNIADSFLAFQEKNEQAVEAAARQRVLELKRLAEEAAKARAAEE